MRRNNPGHNGRVRADSLDVDAYFGKSRDQGLGIVAVWESDDFGATGGE
jgi:hypothetical protein